MINILNYLTEKLHLNKGMKSQVDYDDPSTWDVGDILVAQWGYDMTIVDFYEITKITGSHKTFTLKNLKNKIVSGNGMQGTCVPEEGKYENDKELRARVTKYNRAKVDGEYLSLWSGKPVHFDHMN